MTFEEMQQTLSGVLTAQSAMQRDLQTMLAVQRDLQEGQIRNQQNIAELTQNVNRLVGYSIDHETDLDGMRSELNSLKTRVDRLEERSN
jgi:hypothetical protein